jgi:hypothetical protein
MRILYVHHLGMRQSVTKSCVRHPRRCQSGYYDICKSFRKAAKRSYIKSYIIVKGDHKAPPLFLSSSKISPSFFHQREGERSQVEPDVDGSADPFITLHDLEISSRADPEV